MNYIFYRRVSLIVRRKDTLISPQPSDSPLRDHFARGTVRIALAPTRKCQTSTCDGVVIGPGGTSWRTPSVESRRGSRATEATGNLLSRSSSTFWPIRTERSSFLVEPKFDRFAKKNLKRWQQLAEFFASWMNVQFAWNQEILRVVRWSVYYFICGLDFLRYTLWIE